MTDQHPKSSADIQPRPAATATGGSTAFLFLLIATGLCFAVASPAIFGAVSEEFVGLIVPAAQLTPFAAAVVLFLLLRPGRFGQVFALRWGGSWRAIGLGLATVVLIGLMQLGAGLAFGGYTPNPVDAVLLAAVAVPVVLVLQSVFAIGEEFGWRGWLVSHLQERPFWQIAVVSAVFWMLWHVPALPLIAADDWQVAAAYLLAIGSWAPFMVALRLYSGSVWPAVIIHGALNSVRVFFTQSIASGSGVAWEVEILGWVLWIAAAWWLMSRVRKVGMRAAGMARWAQEN